MVKFGVLLSGSGTNFQAVLDACEAGTIAGEVAVVISSNANAYGLIRAQNQQIPHYVSQDQIEIDNLLLTYDVDYVLLLGYLQKVSPEIIQKYPNKIINIHPSLLPAFGGEGCYGMHVHTAAIEKGVKYSGATVHYVNENYDDGKIIQQKLVTVAPEDTPEDLQRKVQKIEHPLLIQAIQEVIQ